MAAGDITAHLEQWCEGDVPVADDERHQYQQESSRILSARTSDGDLGDLCRPLLCKQRQRRAAIVRNKRPCI